MAQLYLVRHGQASFGAADYDKLSELGQQQSLLLGQYFFERNTHFDHIITGSMLRHKETADGIQQGLASNLEQEVDAGWNEFDFGAVVKAYISLHPNEKPKDDAPRAVFYRLLKVAMYAWSKQELGDGLPETWQEFRGRVQQSVDNLCASPYKKVLVASSGGAIAMAMMNMLNLSVENTVNVNLQIKNTSVSHFFFNKQGMQLASFNNVGHLDTPEREKLISYS
ncbi:histidine phosphatase family protein [Glaciecola sp. MH2013]|uniref:histidine phosphatase family protein n=1 Tax=Glaciecola sp. MH2013 TaxID=2785524 RepID=UPI00189F37F5|nr:histidine phosphatase family protein [Glaciecola sp. MH2013]MBF7073028.1 histidine phosphatase family protein [Glaciecola sp. MH2013]